ncbi:hypothetical protein [Acidovorax sp.]|uniref:hypothetical protein n=1 Tax=unclassified Acidovorax TaxID=2684926 RepID=UPI0025BEC533|nr:hypothetical protein [Acidovorax sp.]MCE1194484.1 hypothetical protein [Acidovorax sp.]
MNAMRIVGVLLLLLGLAAFWAGGSPYAREPAPAALSPVQWMVQEQQDAFVIPQWASLGAMVLGGAALVLGFRRR